MTSNKVHTDFLTGEEVHRLFPNESLGDPLLAPSLGTTSRRIESPIVTGNDLKDNDNNSATDTSPESNITVNSEYGTTNQTGKTTLQSKSWPQENDYWLIQANSDNNQVPKRKETDNVFPQATEINNLPDLLVQNVFLPGEASPGIEIEVSYEVTNLGLGAAGDSWTYFYLSEDETFSGDDLELGYQFLDSLNGGETSSKFKSLSLPNNLAAGNYYLLFRADGYNNQVSESDEANNVFAQAIEITLPDLLVQNVSLTGEVSPGSNITVSYEVMNLGPGAASDSWTYFYLSEDETFSGDDLELGYQSLDSLNGGETSSQSKSLSLPSSLTPGNYYLLFHADGYNNEVSESDETNNVFVQAIEISLPDLDDLPDLVVQNLSLPPEASPGSDITVNYEVTNQGSGAARSSWTYFYLSEDNTHSNDDLELGYQYLNSLNEGETSSQSKSLSLPSSINLEDYYLLVKADGYNNQVLESNETNNSLAHVINEGNEGNEQTGRTIFVNKNAAGNGDGSSWQSAYSNLQSALAVARDRDQIWVAKGTYKPTNDNDRTVSFEIPPGVEVYGGFAGDETSLEQRNPEMNKTILSGEIGSGNQQGDNSYHVVYISDTDDSTVLDGFTIQGGYANGFGEDRDGAGIFLKNASSILTNLKIVDNYAQVDGAGVYSQGGRLNLTNSELFNNEAVNNGGGIHLDSSATIENVDFFNNIAWKGGGISLYTWYDPDVTLENVNFSGNQAGLEGGAIYGVQSSYELNGGTFKNNSATQQGGAIAHQSLYSRGRYHYHTYTNVTNSLFIGNRAGTDGNGQGAAFYIKRPGDLTISDATFYNNWGHNVLHRESAFGNLDIKNSVFWNDNEVTQIEGFPPESVSFSFVQNNEFGGENNPGNFFDGTPPILEGDDGELRYNQRSRAKYIGSSLLPGNNANSSPSQPEADITLDSNVNQPLNNEANLKLAALDSSDSLNYQPFQLQETYLSRLVENKDFVPNEVVVKFNLSARAYEIAAVQKELGALVKGTTIGGIQLWEVKNRDIKDVIAQYSYHPAVKFMEPNFRVEATNVTVSNESVTGSNDPRFDELWGLNNTGQTGGTPDADIDALKAWELATGDHKVIVGVIDSGINVKHQDLAANIWTNPGEIPGNGIDDDKNGFVDDVHGYNFIDNDEPPKLPVKPPVDDYDDQNTPFFPNDGHGTHVAGIIGGVGNNGEGIIGIAHDKVDMVSLKVFDKDGNSNIFAQTRAIDYAIKNKIKLLNMSFGSVVSSQTRYDAIARAKDAGILVIAAAGNKRQNSDSIPFYPASHSRDLDNVISVAATNHDDQLAWFSNYGAETVDLGAPGEAILSTIPGDRYAKYSGTSMAAPHVTGVAALVLARNPHFTYKEVKEQILDSVDPVVALAGKTVTGGRLNAFKALGGRDNFLGFEDGYFTEEWNSIGSASVESGTFGLAPTEGFYQALITTGDGAVSDAELENFLGLNAGALDDFGNGDVTEGSALQIELTVEAGEVLHFDWNFLTNEDTSLQYDDFGIVSISDGSLSKLASTDDPLFTSNTISFASETGYGTFSHEFTDAGTYTVGVGVVDGEDRLVNSGLLVDNFTLLTATASASTGLASMSSEDVFI